MTTTTQVINQTAVPNPRTAHQPALTLRPLRLALRPDPGRGARRTGLVDGAWWPYSIDLVTELVPLLAEMAQRGHLVHRISYSLRGWDAAPRKLIVDGELVRLGGYRTQSPAVLHLIDSSGHAPLELVVVPPTTSLPAAATALRLAVESSALDAAGVLAAAP